MELSKAILTRRSVRSFRKESIPEDKIREMVKAAAYAPSAGNCQPWHFYVVRDERTKKRIWEEACRQEFLANAPVLIVVCVEENEPAKRYGERGRVLYNIQNTAAAVQNILLSATDMGLGSCWCGDFDGDSLNQILGMGGRIPVALVAVGYASFEPCVPKRRGFKEIVTYVGEWGEQENIKADDIKKIEHCDMAGTVFHDVNLYGAEISDVNLAGGKIYNCNLSNMEIYDCHFEGMKINGNHIEDLLDAK